MGNTPAAKEPDFIEIVGSREHNLDVDRLEVPKRQLVVFTGVSGSGKSSLAFDTLYAEGQRRYLETLSAYARQFLGQLERPHVERIRGLSPTIAIEQKSASSNPRSTVGTITEVYDYLRVLYARAGEQHCHVCGKKVKAQTADEITRTLLELPKGTKVVLVRAARHPSEGRVSRGLRRPRAPAASPASTSTAPSTSSMRSRRSTRRRSTRSRSCSTA